jgi:hypothetical protein
VIGVMPATFSHRNGDVYVPLQRKLDPSTRGSHFLVTYARLKIRCAARPRRQGHGRVDPARVLPNE